MIKHILHWSQAIVAAIPMLLGVPAARAQVTITPALSPTPSPDELPSQEALTTAERAAARRYELACRHAVRNTTKQTLGDVKVFFAVPPDTSSQTITNFTVKVGDTAVNPTMRPDGFGQMIARVTLRDLKPGEERVVTATWTAALLSPPKIDLDSAKVGTLADIPKDLIERFACDRVGTYDLGDEAIKKTAAELARGKTNLIEVVRAFHDFVADRKRFTYERGDGWAGAGAVLKSKHGSCSEFSFLFAALCRSHGLPTRLVGATLHSASAASSSTPYIDTVHHRWVEVYLPGYEWVPVDATLDRGSPPKQAYFGTYGPRCLILSRTDTGSTLGKQYLSANTDGGDVSRTRSVTWSLIPSPPAPPTPEPDENKGL